MLSPSQENALSVAVVGASGNVGREILKILHARSFPLRRLDALASPRSAGRVLSFGGKTVKIAALDSYDFSECDLAFFAAGGAVARDYAPIAAKNSLVIDLSSHFRMEKDIPLIMPEVNGGALAKRPKRGIIANMNCAIAPVVMALKPLHDKAGLKRVHAATYQSVSGAGRAGMEELARQIQDQQLRPPPPPRPRRTEKSPFTKPIAFNAIPHIDAFRQDGETGEEWKMAAEFSKILEEEIPFSSLCVRVPVMVGHAAAVWAEFKKPLSAHEARQILKNAPGCQLIDKPENGGYATPLDAEGQDPVFVSRIREDKTAPHGLVMWVVSDNLRKGAALNAVQIAEELVKKKILA